MALGIILQKYFVMFGQGRVFFVRLVFCFAGISVCSCITRGQGSDLENAVNYMYAGEFGGCLKPASVNQMVMCKKVAGMKNVTSLAAETALSSCKQLFQYEHWNCSLALAKEMTKEEGLLYSMLGASMAYWGARGCSEGWFGNCRCGRAIDDENTRKALRNGICPPNMPYVTKLIMKFMGLINDTVTYDEHVVRSHNYLRGIQTLREETKVVCICLGLLGKCMTRVCWKDVPDFDIVAANLKTQYFVSLKLNSNQGFTPTEVLTRYKKKLVHTSESMDYCAITPGRKCRNEDNCSQLCCARGFYTKNIDVDVRCNCVFVPSIMNVKCEVCQTSQKELICK